MGKRSEKFFDVLGGIGSVGSSVIGTYMDLQERERQRKRDEFNQKIIEEKYLQSIEEAKNKQAKQKILNAFWRQRAENPLNEAVHPSVPMFGPQGKPLGVAVESGLYEDVQRPADIALIDAYKSIDETAPAWLTSRAKETLEPFQVATPSEALKQKAEDAINRAKIDSGGTSQTTPQWIAVANAHLAVDSGNANAFQKKLVELHPISEGETIFGVKFGTLRKIISDSYPLERPLMGSPTGARVNLPIKVNNELLRGNPMPMYEYVANQWIQQKLAEGLDRVEDE